MTLKAILGYHVTGKIMAADPVGQTKELQTAAGIPLSVDGTGDAVILGGAAPVVSADIETANGVIHVIAGILLLPVSPDHPARRFSGERLTSPLRRSVDGKAQGLLDEPAHQVDANPDIDVAARYDVGEKRSVLRRNAASQSGSSQGHSAKPSHRSLP